MNRNLYRAVGVIEGMVVCLFILFAQSVLAQEKHVRKDLPKKHHVSESIVIGDCGLLLKVGNLSISDWNTNTFMYYNAQCDPVWEKKVIYEYSKGKRLLVTSPTVEILYSVEIAGADGKDFSGKKHYLTQIRKDGKDRKLELDGKEEFGKSLQTVFCDDQYLYYLATQNGDEENDKKKHEDKLILNRFSHNDLSYKRFVLDLPPIAEGESTTFWSFIGQKNGENYLVSKAVDPELGKNIFLIVAFNSEGKMTKTSTIAVNLDRKFTRPSWRVESPRQPSVNLTDMNFVMKTSRSASVPNMGTTITTRPVPTAGAFGYLALDELNACFYSYGLFGPKPFQKVGPVYEGFYIIKYSLDGNEIWRLQEMGTKELLGESTFRVHATPSDRNICLKVLPDGELNFSIQFAKSLYDYDISPEGKLLGKQKKNDVLALTGNVYKAIEKLKSDDFIKKDAASAKSKSINYVNALTPSGEILIKIDTKESGFDLYYFKK